VGGRIPVVYSSFSWKKSLASQIPIARLATKKAAIYKATKTIQEVVKPLQRK
jgi:hypothetical protein